MKLSELFVSHKQVDPVSFKVDTPELPKNIYLNLDRAQKAANPEDTSQENLEQKPEHIYNWSVEYKPKTEIKSEKPIQVPYREGSEPKEESKKEQKSVTKKGTSLAEYRKSSGYKTFKAELDKFIDNNPKYQSIKDHLDYLAALESSYELGVQNGQGSGALGWFQFMDNTRAPYNKQSRADFAKDAQQQLNAAAQHYTNLQKQIRARGGDANDFVTMYGAWWRPESAYAYLKDNNYDYRTSYNESLSGVRQKAKDLLS